jgi:2-phosphosulfolactate phosphatase
MPIVDVAVLPGLVPMPIDGVAVVFDVLRATTTMAALLDAGASGIRAVGEIVRARELKNADPGLLLAGERGGVPPAGFDMGNSPVRIDHLVLAGRVVVMTTTNGTKAVERASAARACLMGSLINLDALAERLRDFGQDVVLICSGTDGGRSDEDELAAGMLVERLRGWSATEAAEDAADRATGSVGVSGGIAAAVGRSWHARRLVEMGYGEDVTFCSRLSITRTVPTLDAVSGLIVKG